VVRDMPDELPILAFATPAAWQEWLAAEHATAPGVWLKLAKRASGNASVSYAEALDVALCFGWIDSRREALDEQYFLQRYTPRQPRGRWSRINREKVERLTAEGRMRASGLAEVDRAKADGRWDAAYEPARTATVPPDLAAALAQDERARRRYESLGRTDRYLVILRLQTARTPEARAARLRRMVATLAAGDPVR
jgi:uncharacterized protein YdeI (YjbR/CyaY-like superfamily)